MCGIAGIFAHRPSAAPVDAAELLRVREAMARRGPDGEGLWIGPAARVGLAHRRLAVIDLSEAAAQPMASADGRLRITFNGEIYNYRELRERLEARGRVMRTQSDTEVLLHLYDEMGADMLGELRGMFAFAIWDETRQGLFLARDPFGIKPLYYADDGSTLRFASQVKALVRAGAIDCHPDPAGIVGFHVWGFVPEPLTLHREIRSLPAGSHLWADRSGCRPPVRYFDVRGEFAAAEERADDLRPAPDDAERVLGALEESVRQHMVADVPVAAFLSAGLDSSTMVALASRIGGHDLRTLTLGFEEYAGTQNDETATAALVAARFSTAHQTCWVTREDFERGLDDILQAMDQPSTDGVNTYLVSKAAAETGIKVALSGLGGDELFAGYPSFRDVPRIRRFAAASGLPPRAGAWLRRRASPLLARITSPKYAGLLEYGGTHGGAYLLRRGLFMPWELEDVMEPDVARRGWEELATVSALDASVAGLARDRSIVSALEVQWYMRNQLLRDSDWAGMAHSLEIRVPYVDTALLRAVLPRLVGGDRMRKRDIAVRVPGLPHEVVTRNKTGFLVPVQQWCTSVSEAGDHARGLRGWARIVTRGRGALAATPGSSRASAATHAAALAAACSYRAINGLLGLAALVLWPRPRPRAPRNICIFRIGNIGDIACALPAMRAVREAYPEARIVLLSSPGRRTQPGAAEVLAGATWLDEIRTYHSEDISTHAGRTALLRELRARRFDMWIDLPNNLTTTARQFRDMAFARMAGVGWARGWRIDTLKWAAKAQSECLQFPNEVERTLRMVRNMGIAARHVDFGLAREDEVVRRVDGLLGAQAPRRVAIAPGAKRATNLWRSERFAEVGRVLAANGYRVVLLGGPQETQVCAGIAAAIGPGALSLAGALTVAESCEVLRRSHLAICVDSGVQHLASAVGTPVVSLFSFWQMLGKWRPHGAASQVIQKWVPCHTCLLDECPRGNLCMARISVADVLEAAQRSLAVPDAGRKPVEVRLRA
jgi:asparagine synthase (glutamine-hydrolysing)